MIQQKRNTKSKQLVYDLLEEFSSALSHDDIVRKLSGKMDRVTVYRILQGFCDDGKVHKITGDNGKTYYALCQGCSEKEHNDNHVHFRCIGCNTVSCLNETVIIPQLPSGYDVLNSSCTLSGYCPDCLNTEKLEDINI
jgi:Fe2+ or Zn2+ uptake regulation protein